MTSDSSHDLPGRVDNPSSMFKDLLAFLSDVETSSFDLDLDFGEESDPPPSPSTASFTEPHTLSQANCVQLQGPAGVNEGANAGSPTTDASAGVGNSALNTVRPSTASSDAEVTTEAVDITAVTIPVVSADNLVSKPIRPGAVSLDPIAKVPHRPRIVSLKHAAGKSKRNINEVRNAAMTSKVSIIRGPSAIRSFRKLRSLRRKLHRRYSNVKDHPEWPYDPIRLIIDLAQLERRVTGLTAAVAVQREQEAVNAAWVAGPMRELAPADDDGSSDTVEETPPGGMGGSLLASFDQARATAEESLRRLNADVLRWMDEVGDASHRFY